MGVRKNGKCNNPCIRILLLTDGIICYVTLGIISTSKSTQNIRQGLSKTESFLLSSLASKGKSIFTMRDIISELDCSYDYAKNIAKVLAKKKWTINLKRGTYLIVPLSAGVDAKYTEHEFIIASHLVSPYYIGYWSALNFYNMTEQTPLTVFIATTKRAKSRTIMDVRYRFITLDKKKFFGFSSISLGSDRVNISDREKTIADALDHPEYCGGMAEVAKCISNARDSISIEKVLEYAQRMGNSTIIKRLGFLLDILDIRYLELYPRMMGMISPGMSILDPTIRPRQDSKGKYNTKWNLLVNVPKDSLVSWKQESQ